MLNVNNVKQISEVILDKKDAVTKKNCNTRFFHTFITLDTITMTRDQVYQNQPSGNGFLGEFFQPRNELKLYERLYSKYMKQRETAQQFIRLNHRKLC